MYLDRHRERLGQAIHHRLALIISQPGNAAGTAQLGMHYRCADQPAIEDDGQPIRTMLHTAREPSEHIAAALRQLHFHAARSTSSSVTSNSSAASTSGRCTTMYS